MASVAAQVPVLPVCDLCGSSEEVNWFCQDCQERLCNRCKIAHQGGRKTKNDDIISIAEVKGQTTSKIVPLLCQEHRTKVCELYCKRCEQLICSQCLDKGHKSHEFYSVEKLIESKTSELDAFDSCLRSKLLSFESVIKEESQQYSDFIAHVDKLMLEVKDEVDKIIQQFIETRDKHISDLNQLKKMVEEKYKTTCNQYQNKTSEIRKTVDDIKSAKASGNAEIMIKSVLKVEQKIPCLDVPTPSKFPLPDFQHNACQPSSIMQLAIPDIDEVPSQTLSMMSISQPVPVANQPTLDMENVEVVVRIEVQGKSEAIRAIIPIDNNKIWIVVYPEHHLTLVDICGVVAKTSLDVGGQIFDAVAFRTDLLCTTWKGHRVIKVSKDGDSVTIFSDLSPFFTGGMSVSNDKVVLLCLTSSMEFNDVDSKVIRLNERGEVLQEIKSSNQIPLFSSPDHVTSPAAGDVVVLDSKSNDVRRLMCFDKSGNYKYTWAGKIGSNKLQKFYLSRLTHNNNNVYITDVNNHRLYVLDRNGIAEQLLLKKKHGIKNPVAINIDNKGQLWLGCRGAKLYMLK